MDPEGFNMRTLETINPFTLKPIHQYPVESFQEVFNKIERSQKAFREWKKLRVSERVDAVRQALIYFSDHKDELAHDITAQMAKPINQSHNELNTFFERANHLCDHAEKALSPEPVMGKTDFHREIRHEPLGLVFIIAAWNYPLVIAVNGILSSLLSGNTVLLKHSSLTPSIGLHFEKAFRTLGGIDNVLQNVIIDHSTTLEVIEKGDIQHVIFTGSVQGGRNIYQSVSQRFMDCNLELGGKDGAYVAEDANLKEAVAGLVDGAMYNAGQSCCGIERVYVHQSLYDDFVSQSKTLLETYILGDPLGSQTSMGPLARGKSVEELHQQVQEAMNQGAELHHGGKIKRIGDALFFEPTLITSVHNDMIIMREENFGPILPIMKVKDDEEGFRLVADSKYGLTSVIYTENQEKAEAFSRQMDTGTVFMNRCDYLDPALPWTGVGLSGKGSTLSDYGFHSVTRRKALHFRLLS